MAEKESAIEGFKNFILRGNVVDLAVAVVIGMALGAVISAIVKDIINPLIGAIFSTASLSTAGIATLNNSKFFFGDLLANVINFVAISAVVYFLIVRPVSALLKRFASGEETVTAPDPQLELLSEIRDLLAGGARLTK